VIDKYPAELGTLAIALIYFSFAPFVNNLYLGRDMQTDPSPDPIVLFLMGRPVQFAKMILWAQLYDKKHSDGSLGACSSKKRWNGRSEEWLEIKS
jgi:hypothetical protein